MSLADHLEKLETFWIENIYDFLKVTFSWCHKIIFLN